MNDEFVMNIVSSGQTGEDRAALIERRNHMIPIEMQEKAMQIFGQGLQ